VSKGYHHHAHAQGPYRGCAMSAPIVLDRLSGVRQTGPNSWIARCAGHEDRSPSLRVSEADGRVLLHCFAGCRTQDVLDAIGLTFADLFEKPPERGHQWRKPRVPASDVLQALADEIMVAVTYICNFRNGVELSEDDHQRFILAAGRILAGQEVASGRR